MGLRAGDLNQQVTIRRKTRTTLPTGGFSTVWTDLATVWAKIEGLDGRESIIAQALQGVSHYRITVRYRSDIADSDQLRYGTIALNIRSIADPDGRRERQHILCDTGSTE